MEPSNEQPKRSGSSDGWLTRTLRTAERATNDCFRKNYSEPQAQAAADAATREALATAGEYALPVLTGAGAVGLATHGLVEWFNSKRKDGEYKLPTGLLTMLATLGGGTLGGYLWNRYGKKASADIPVEVDPSKEVSAEDQEALTDPQGKKKKKKKELPSNITQMIYAQNAKKRYDSMKTASLTYSKVAELMSSTNKQTTTQGNGTIKFDQSTQNPKFTTPKPVQPVQPPHYRQADTTVKDTESSII